MDRRAKQAFFQRKGMCVCVLNRHFSKEGVCVYVCVCMCECVLVAQLCPTICDPMDCSLPGFTVHGISQARILERVAISFSQRRHTYVQKAYEKMFNIANYQRSSNQNYNEVSPHTRQTGYHQTMYNQSIQKRVWRNGALLHCWWECKLLIETMENCMEAP